MKSGQREALTKAAGESGSFGQFGSPEQRADAEIFRPVRPRRISDSAMEQIVGLLRDGTLKPGERMPPERELMSLLSVSRTSLREAIRILETQGLLRVLPGRGTYVDANALAPPSDRWLEWLAGHRNQAMQLLETHEALEVRVASLAAERSTPQQVDALQECVDDMRRAVETGDHEALVAADAAFHRTLQEASGNEIIARFLTDLDEMVVGTRRAIMSLDRKIERVVEEHQGIADAVAAGDARRAADLVLAHVQRSMADMLAAVDREREGSE